MAEQAAGILVLTKAETALLIVVGLAALSGVYLQPLLLGEFLSQGRLVSPQSSRGAIAGASAPLLIGLAFTATLAARRLSLAGPQVDPTKESHWGA